MIIEGAISIKSAINNKKRDISVVYINKDKKTKDFNYIRKICKLNNIIPNILFVSNQKFAKVCGVVPIIMLSATQTFEVYFTV